MASPAEITNWALVAAAVATLALNGADLLRRRKRENNQDQRTEEEAAQEQAESVAGGWMALWRAQREEIKSLREERAADRAEYEATIAAMRRDYEEKLATAARKIADLERDIESLRRYLLPPGQQ
jgi:ribosomal protein L19E